jgi:HEAT repeat protein
LSAALADSDPVVRGLAAVALRNCGLCAEPVLPALVERLKDADQNVRIAAADAIAKLGEKAAPAVAALIEAAESQNMHPHVQRSVAAALGAIGPAASPALPVLERLRKQIRVRWIAQSAIARIKNQPPPTGPEPSR